MFCKVSYFTEVNEFLKANKEFSKEEYNAKKVPQFNCGTWTLKCLYYINYASLTFTAFNPFFPS